MEIRPGSNILSGDSAASVHCTGDSAFYYNKISHTLDEEHFILSDGNNMEVKVCD